MSLAFLQTIKVEDPSLMKKSTGGGRRKEWNPTGMKIRVWKDGSVFPSKELVDRFNLEYGNQPTEEGQVETGNAFDIFSSADFPIFKADETLLLLNVAPKSAPKTDVFGSTTYNEDGTPKSSVMEQGSATFGKATLLPLLTSMYGVTLGDNKEYEDLILLGQGGENSQQAWGLPDGKTVCHVPKVVARGERKGEMSYSRRENPQFFVLYPSSVLYPDQKNQEEVTEVLAEETAVPA